MRFPISRLSALLLVCASAVHADPILTSWFTENSGVLARVIQSGTLTTPVTTWPAAGVTNNNTGGAAQTVPAYADVQRIRYTATDVYINASGFGSYTMGPWFNNAGGLFGFWPLARDYHAESRARGHEDAASGRDDWDDGEWGGDLRSGRCVLIQADGEQPDGDRNGHDGREWRRLVVARCPRGGSRDV
jgi:hypothetical protein